MIPAIRELAQRIKVIMELRVASREETDWDAVACEAVTIATTLAVCGHPYSQVSETLGGWVLCHVCGASMRG